MVRGFLLLIAVGLFFTLLALGTWQVQRRQWKLDLIERATQRVHAAVVPAPGPALWHQVDAAHYEYQHVSAQGTWLAACTAWTQAVTELGSGYWLLMPLRQTDGAIVFINRGFVADQDRADATAALRTLPPATDTITIHGLLRIAEPHGGFLRNNDPSTGRWFSRDVPAIASSCHLDHSAPYFIDADADASPIAHAPIGGLTVISFHNNHLVYALTWYTLALMVAWGGWRLLRETEH